MTQFTKALCMGVGFIMLATGVAPKGQAQPIFRCDGGDVPPLFTGKPCASAHQLNPVIANRYQLPPLTIAQQQQLAQLKHNTKQAPQVARQMQQFRAHQQKQNQRQAHECSAQRDALRTLQQKRRKGYGLDQLQKLEQAEQKLRQSLRSNC